MIHLIKKTIITRTQRHVFIDIKIRESSSLFTRSIIPQQLPDKLICVIIGLVPTHVQRIWSHYDSHVACRVWRLINPNAVWENGFNHQWVQPWSVYGSIYAYTKHRIEETNVEGHKCTLNLYGSHIMHGKYNRRIPCSKQFSRQTNVWRTTDVFIFFAMHDRQLAQNSGDTMIILSLHSYTHSAHQNKAQFYVIS